MEKIVKGLKSWYRRHGSEFLIDAFIGIFVVGLIFTGVLMVWIATLDIPDLSSFEERQVQQSTKIYDRTGTVLLYDLHQDIRRTIVPYENISRHLKNASVAIEDDTFFEHFGIRPLRIAKAVFDNLVSGDLLGGQGGSTITQQVVKNSVLVQEKSLTRKIKEWILALRLEQVLSKEEILGHYLNESPYGGTIYGVEEASLSFFGKHASEVNLAEAAYLASLPQLPTYYSPYGSHVEDLEKRKNLVLLRMLENGFITEEEYNEAKTTVVEFKPQMTSGIRAPHFVMYVRDLLVEQYGESVAEKGYKIITTLDWELQEKAEEIVLARALSNEKSFNAENAALVAADPTNGEVLVMVGSRDYFDTEIDGNYNIAVAERQPGSSFKPFVYATAFKKGYTPETVVFDLKTQFSTACPPNDTTSEGDCYSPENYDLKFRGPVNFRNALAQSLNIPAVKALYLAGINDSLKMARDMGISTLTNSAQYGLTLVLGGGEVKLLEMVGAYGTFANEGVRNELRPFIRFEDSVGNVIEEFEAEPKQVLDRNIALQISDILSDNVARTPLYGANSSLNFPGRDVAAKTGTTNDKRDVWILGYTPNLVVGAWAGNNDNSSMSELSGLVITPLWRDFMDVALPKFPTKVFTEPERTPDTLKPILRGVWFDPTQMIVDEPELTDSPLSVHSAVQGAHDILYYVDKDNPNAPGLGDHSDPQFPYWEYPVSLWKSALLPAAPMEDIEFDDDDEESERSIRRRSRDDADEDNTSDS